MNNYLWLEKYKSLCSKFIKGDMKDVHFEKLYLKMFINEKNDMSNSIYLILNELFLDVEDYCSDITLRDEGDIDEEELLKRTKIALEKLDEFK